ncbi:hypothetical protein BC827DRAFT_1268379 [Russula dissimulans]|nr:hypothetical protein BC827DRAFT_1268379 [Russula dissimulans]
MALAPLAQNVIEVAQGKFRSLLGVPVGDIVLLAAIPGYWYHFTDEIELSREIWSTVRDVVHSVTVALDSERQISTGLVERTHRHLTPASGSFAQLAATTGTAALTRHQRTPQSALPQQSRNDIQTIRVRFGSGLGKKIPHASQTP